MSKIQDVKRERSTTSASPNRAVALKTVAAADKGILCRLHCRKKRISVSLSALSETFAALKYPSILGANSARKDTDRFSYWAAYPKEVFEFRAGHNDPFTKLQRALKKYKLAEKPADDLPKGIFRAAGRYRKTAGKIRRTGKIADRIRKTAHSFTAACGHRKHGFLTNSMQYEQGALPRRNQENKTLYL
jgi:hypothetical protein